MARFNSNTVSGYSKEPNTVNKAGGEAYTASPKLELATVLLNSFVSDKFYSKASDQLAAIRRLVGVVEPEFAAKAALFARNEFGMRSITHALAGELARATVGVHYPWKSSFYENIVRRLDDMAEIISYYGSINGNKTSCLPMAMRKGFARRLERADAYELGKYRLENKALTMADIVSMVHPNPTPELNALMNDREAGRIRSKTYQAGLTNAGKTATSAKEKAVRKAEVWEEFVANPKVEYFALLRNLRNIAEQADAETLDKALEVLTDERRIKKSLVLPFRFQTAINELSGHRKVVVALNRALDISVSNVPKFDGKTLVALDVSGSMRGKPIEIGALFAAAIVKANHDADAITFSDYAREIRFNPADSMTTIAKSFVFTGGSTNFHSIFEWAGSKKYDRIIILSDMQGWMKPQYWLSTRSGYSRSNPKETFAHYRRASGANPNVFSFDLSTEGTLQFPESKVFAIAGFSEKVFDLMAALEEDPKALVHRIEAVKL